MLYIEANTKDKVYISGGPEFGLLEEHTLLVDKVLYGLMSSDLCWHQRIADVLRAMGFIPNKANCGKESKRNSSDT
jgi:hypothetical protein